jgi:hypothetical protein
MKRKLIGCLAPIALGTVLVVATPAMAFHGGGGFGGGGFGGGMHGGGFGGGMHGGGFGGGMHGGGLGGGMHSEGFSGTRGGGFVAVHNEGFGNMNNSNFIGMHGGGFAAQRGGFVNMHEGNRFAGAAFARGPVFGNRFNNFNRSRNFAFRHHHRFRNFAFVGAPFFYDDYGADYDDGCQRQVWTPYGWNWANVCYGYGY